ncbi:methyltransferase type 11 [Mangrovactinospora gilvigrisea]|uniref:Methyltransferase type 11 n=1 Tax=Mangrovactinospora gilvigrisea TaxID=1428644 RepID=A0A1J7BEB2_9ACTN|nr:class I SAM-dependent methyltransferase [Mangrovactinospora gilvigrisea]OIV37031.1 methyltransferase type 11 [Mangrovactinospora gilvigrisea]
MSEVPQETVEAFYDAKADAYLAAYVEGVQDDPRLAFLPHLDAQLAVGASVLELGCGAGIPATAALARRYRVLGVDLSATQLHHARWNVPTAAFRKADMTALDLPDGSVDAVTAFYCFNHLPLGEQPRMLAAIARWLRPGGLLLASFGTGAAHGEVAQWLGAPVYFSSHDMPANRRHLADAGFTLLVDELIAKGEERWQWVVARTGAAPGAAT